MWIPLLWRRKVQPRASATSAGGARNSNPEIRLMPLILNGLLEGLARLEGRNLGGRDLHLLPALRISALPGLLLSNVELPKARNLDLLARLERFGYGPRESLQVLLGIALGSVGVLDHLLNHLLLVHASVHLACGMWTLVTYPHPETAQTCKRTIPFPASLPVTPRTSEKSLSTHSCEQRLFAP